MRALFLLLVLSSYAFGSDHIDGPVTMKHRLADLADFYAFPTPQKSGYLTLILNTYPIVPSKGHFDHKVSFRLTFRKASIKQYLFTTDQPSEIRLTCTFVTPHEHSNHEATCRSSNGLVAKSVFNKLDPAAGPFRLYAGMRSDPFFFNPDWAKAAATKGQILPPKNNSVMKGVNVLSLVMEIESAKLFPGYVGLVAIATEALAQDTPTASPRRLDRLGRPEITNVSLVSREKAAELRDLSISIGPSTYQQQANETTENAFSPIFATTTLSTKRVIGGTAN